MIILKVITAKSYEEMKKRGGVKISFGVHESPVGKCLIGVQGKRICHISFVVASEEENLNALKRQWPGSDLVKEEKRTGKMVEEIFGSDGLKFEVMSKGSSFEASVWEALLKIPKGTTVSYEEVAVMIGHKKAVRAVANAVGKNPVSYLVPCHRVIRKDGSLHKYRWGADVKKKLLAFENCYF